MPKLGKVLIVVAIVFIILNTIMPYVFTTPTAESMGERGLEVLSRKYSGYEFEILRYDGIETDARFFLKEKTTGESLKMRVIKKGAFSYKVMDTFWTRFVEEEYEEYCKEKLREKLDKIGDVNIVFTYGGEDCDLNITVEDIIEGRMSVYSSGTIHIAANGMTKEECKSYVEKVRQAVEEINIAPVSYWIEFWDMTVEEMEASETFIAHIYKTSIVKE